MKMSKQQFKTLMKECLSELINEGAFDKKLEQISEAKKPVGSYPQATMPTGHYQPAPANTTNQSTPVVNPMILERVRNITSGYSMDPARKSMFESVLIDTAMTTLQNRIANGDGQGCEGLYNPIHVSKETVAHDDAQLASLAGGNPSRWAAAAFGGRSSNKNR